MSLLLAGPEEQCHLSVRQRMLKPLTFRATQLQCTRIVYLPENRCLPGAHFVFEIINFCPFASHAE